ncbi:MAG: fibronectin type III domain-containing protein [Lentisphaerae bacterium]|nr:fibronectin type III domain-containing protein [Lentisphaerota bacterium]MBT5605658.1 fibronectin type III domain-containing protein [Lentisphaerota bacterium]MBT7056323.1 fibronectin type III domain-containing protein [Lentisphaerota bacterium]MBT7843638.1 fibronectin type III domain-containing protein [Lentisphaerota bacterium]
MNQSLCLLTLAWSAVSVGAIAKPGIPGNVRAVGRNGEVALAWSPVPGADAYVVSHTTSAGGPYAVLDGAVAATHYVAMKLANDTRHLFVVSATGPGGQGAPSAEVSATPFRLWPEGDEWPFTFRTRVKSQHAFFHLWLPPNTPVIKGVFAFTYHGCGGTLAELPDMRYLAASLDSAIVGLGGETTKRGFRPSRIMFDALDDLGRQSNHPELVNAPIFTFGHSNGTGFAAGFADQEPERVIGWIAFKSANGRQFSLPPIYAVPGLVLSGERDRTYFNNQLDTVERLRREQNALMGMIVEPKAGHGPNGRKSYGICLAFMRTVFRLRVPADADPRQGPVTLNALLPESGWLGANWEKATGGGQRLETAPCGELAGDASRASWFPNEDFARCRQQFSETGQLATWW